MTSDGQQEVEGAQSEELEETQGRAVARVLWVLFGGLALIIVAVGVLVLLIGASIRLADRDRDPTPTPEVRYWDEHAVWSRTVENVEWT